MTTRPMHYPCKPGDWVSDGSQIAKVKSVDWDGAEIVVDLIFYANSGDKQGRVSPAMGGPRSFEPCCSWKYWHRVPEPNFPIQIKWHDEPDGRRVLGYHHGAPQPERQWKKPVRRSRSILKADERFRRALEQIAAGHNDARALAEATLRANG